MGVSPLTGSSVIRKVFAQTVSRRNPRVPELWVRGGGLPVCLCWGTGRCGRSPCGCMCCVPKPGWGAEASRSRSPYPTSVMTWEAQAAEPGPGSVGAGGAGLFASLAQALLTPS